MLTKIYMLTWIIKRTLMQIWKSVNIFVNLSNLSISFSFLRYAPVRHVKSVFSNPRNLQTSRASNLRLGFTMQHSQSIVLIWIQTYGKIFKPSLVYLFAEQTKNSGTCLVSLKSYVQHPRVNRFIDDFT